MRTKISTLRKHCRSMAEAQHKPTCPTLTEREPFWDPWTVAADGRSMIFNQKPDDWWTPPTCDGCLTDGDRRLFAVLADEIEAYEADTLPGT